MDCEKVPSYSLCGKPSKALVVLALYHMLFDSVMANMLKHGSTPGKQTLVSFVRNQTKD